ncbi:MAG TPA: fatty acid desaturase [Gammaproteobacteria bacterium]|jgi:fatty acid desaturase|nr:fatty acid desaturase [Gammaproteobacteria bacterium]
MAKDYKPQDLLSKEQLKIIRKKRDWINVVSISMNWLQILAAMALFFYFPNVLTFLLSVIVIGSRQFALAVLAHDGAHNLLFSNEKINDFVSQWFCAFPLFSDNRPYRPYHLAHHRFTESENDPDLSLSAPFPITKASFRRKVIRDLTGQTGFRRYSIALKSIFSSEADNFAGRIKKISDKIGGFFISNLVIFSLITIFSHWSIYFLLWWIPAFTYYSLIVRIRNIAEHSVTPGETNLNNTRTTKASFLTRYLLVPHHVNFHLEHHLFTNCPWYNLPKVHEMLKGEPLRDKMCIEKSYFSVLRKATSG